MVLVGTSIWSNGEPLLCNIMIDQKLARELYRPTPAPTPERIEENANKIPVQRFQALEQQIRNNPANAQPYEELAGIYIEQNRWRDAKRVLEQGVKHAPDHEPILYLFEDARMRLAREAMDVAAAKFQEYKSAANQRELDQSELEFAALQFEVSEARFKRYPKQHDLLVTSAIALKRLSRIDEAIERLRHAQTNPIFRAVASLNLGICLEGRSQVIEALEAYRVAAYYRSPSPPADIKRKSLELAIALSERCRLYDSAIRYIDQLIIDAPDETETLQAKRKRFQQLSLSQKHPSG
jgi:tetratricopeptide (TPR) repeat protein